MDGGALTRITQRVREARVTLEQCNDEDDSHDDKINPGLNHLLHFSSAGLQQCSRLPEGGAGEQVMLGQTDSCCETS